MNIDGDRTKSMYHKTVKNLFDLLITVLLNNCNHLNNHIQILSVGYVYNFHYY